MTQKAGGTGAAHDTTVEISEADAKFLAAEQKKAEKEIAAQKVAAIEAARRAVDQAKRDVKNAELGLAKAKKENG